MQYTAVTIEDYLAQIPEDRQEPMATLIETINQNLPEGFDQRINYKMPSWVVPHDTYPPGYHCDPKLPLPFLSVASQKNFIAVYHMGIYADADLLAWFTAEYPKHNKRKLDMGKSCIRFKKPAELPYQLIGELCSKMTPQRWIDIYEAAYKKK